MNRIITTTTDTLEGWEINEYYPPVSSNVVVGTNIFSDITASLTDFFRRRSGTYEKKLQQLYSQAISAIESKAKAVSANAIVGLKIDIDGVSGKNSQMFMITAYGTPVKVTRLKANAPESEWSHKSVIDGTYIGQKVIAKRIIEHAVKNGDLTRKDVAFIAENPFPEFVDTALLILKAKSETIGTDENDPDKKTLEKLGELFVWSYDS